MLTEIELQFFAEHPFFLRSIKRRVIDYAVDQSAMRNQLEPGDILRVRSFLRGMSLKKFANAENAAVFFELLNGKTNELLADIQICWGTARKAINLALCAAYFEQTLNFAFQLDRIAEYLEVPIDRQTAKYIRGFHPYLPRIQSIIAINPETHELYQHSASQIAEEKGFPSRIYCEIRAWRRGG
jgi:hypothetical protein